MRPVDQVWRGLLWHAGSIQVHGRKALGSTNASLPRQTLPGSGGISLINAFEAFQLAQLHALTAPQGSKDPFERLHISQLLHEHTPVQVLRPPSTLFHVKHQFCPIIGEHLRP